MNPTPTCSRRQPARAPRRHHPRRGVDRTVHLVVHGPIVDGALAAGWDLIAALDAHPESSRARAFLDAAAPLELSDELVEVTKRWAQLLGGGTLAARVEDGPGVHATVAACYLFAAEDLASAPLTR